LRKEKSRMINNTIYCIKYIWKIDRKYILLMIVISILTSLFNIINLSILRYITEAITMQEMKYFLMIICLMLLLSVVIAIINGSASYLYEPLLQNRIIEKIQSDIYAKAKTFNLEEYDNEEFYDLYYFVAENGKTGILNAITLTTGILTSLMSVMGISSIILQYDFWVISCAFIGVGISCLCSMRMKNLQYKFKIESVPYNREINYIHRIFYLNEYIKEIITFSKSRIFEKKYQAAWSGMNEITNKWGKQIRMQYIGVMLIDSITEIFILIYLGYNTILGKMPIGEFIVLYTGIQQMIQQMKAAVASVPEIYSNALDLEKYFEFMNRRTGEGKEKVNMIEEIRFENVDFSYRDSDKNILHNINFSIGKNNKRIALVGKNGSGKSTIIKLLLGFYEGYDGNIYINSNELRDLSKKEYRNRLSILYQDFRLFSMTVNQNVSMEYENEEEKVDELLKIASVYEKIKNLPLKNQTVLSKEFDKAGIYLSGGEQQKIGLARTLFRTADLVVLDEPFSSMDQLSANKILKEMETTYPDKMMILITHDLHDLSGMDKILVLDEGKIVEEGTEKELILKKGKFFQMWSRNHTKEDVKNEQL
jgi:ATP-binding cassette subfamily B protein